MYSRSRDARAETVAEKPMFRDALEERRCPILAGGFYEWKGQRGSKEPYRTTRADARPVAFASLWEQHEESDEGTWLAASGEEVLQGVLDP